MNTYDENGNRRKLFKKNLGSTVKQIIFGAVPVFVGKNPRRNFLAVPICAKKIAG